MNTVIEHLKYKIRTIENSIVDCDQENADWCNEYPQWENANGYPMIHKDVIDNYKKELAEFKAALKILTPVKQVIKKITPVKNQKRILATVQRYLNAIDVAELANDNCDDKTEVKAIDKQFIEYGKLIENFTNANIIAACRNNDNKRITTFCKMYL